MARIGIVTDSTAYLPRRFKEQYRVEVVSLIVNFEGVGIPEEEMYGDLEGFYEKLRRTPDLPTTSQPSIGDFLDAYQRVGAHADSIISIHITEGISGTIRAARAAAQMLPGLDIAVVDSRATSIGLYMVVEAAARAAAAGRDRDGVLRITRHVVEHSLVLFTLDTLEYLRRGGRIGGGGALLGNLLQIKPILYFNPRQNNTIDLYDKVRTKERALRRILEEVRKAGPNIKPYAAHVCDEAAGRDLVARVRAIYPHLDPELCPQGPVVGTHGGPGTVGLGFYPLTPEIEKLFAV